MIPFLVAVTLPVRGLRLCCQNQPQCPRMKWRRNDHRTEGSRDSYPIRWERRHKFERMAVSEVAIEPRFGALFYVGA
jgi:hypothetical protein